MRADTPGGGGQFSLLLATLMLFLVEPRKQPAPQKERARHGKYRKCDSAWKRAGEEHVNQIESQQAAHRDSAACAFPPPGADHPQAHTAGKERQANPLGKCYAGEVKVLFAEDPLPDKEHQQGNDADNAPDAGNPP